MPRAIIAKLEDVSEPLRAEYRPGTTEENLEGKFVLKVEGSDGWNLENVSGLKSALQTERTTTAGLTTQLKSFEGIDPTKARADATKVAEWGNLDPKKDADRIAQEKIDAAMQQVNQQHQAELAGRDKKLKLRDGLLTDTFKTQKAIEAIVAEKGDPELLLPFVLPSLKLEFDETDDSLTPKLTVLDDKGNTRIDTSTGSVVNMTPIARVKELKSHEKFSRFFEGSGHSGSGDRQQRQEGGGGGGKKLKDMNRREKSALINDIGLGEFNKRVQAERETA